MSRRLGELRRVPNRLQKRRAATRLNEKRERLVAPAVKKRFVAEQNRRRVDRREIVANAVDGRGANVRRVENDDRNRPDALRNRVARLDAKDDAPGVDEAVANRFRLVLRRRDKQDVGAFRFVAKHCCRSLSRDAEPR